MTRTAGSTSKQASAKKAAAKRASAKKATAKKAAVRKSAGTTQTAAKKATAKKAAVRKSAGTTQTAEKKASAQKTAAKKASVRKSAAATQTAAKTTTATKKASAKKTTAAKKTIAKQTAAAKKATARDKVAAAERRAAREAVEGVERAKRATAAAGRVVAWLRAHADGRRGGPPAGASAAQLKKVERAVGVTLPPDLAAWWRLHDGGVSIFEYEGLSCAASLSRREGMEELRLSGVLADHEIFPQSVPRIAATKWHPKWIPLAQDGCGNLYCVDMGPGRMGVFGQVIRWEMRGGAFAASSVVLAELLERYADALESGDFKFADEMFDGPYIDLLEPGSNSRPVRRR